MIVTADLQKKRCLGRLGCKNKRIPSPSICVAIQKHYIELQKVHIRITITIIMSIYEEVEFEDLDFDPVKQIYSYPCPCGDKFSISLEELWDGEDIATCPSCTLRIEIIYDEEDLPPLREDTSGDEDEDEEEGGSVGAYGEVEKESEKEGGDEEKEIDEELEKGAAGLNIKDNV